MLLVYDIRRVGYSLRYPKLLLDHCVFCRKLPVIANQPASGVLIHDIHVYVQIKSALPTYDLPACSTQNDLAGE